MPSINNYVIDQLVTPAFVLFFFIGGLAAVSIGIGLIFKSPKIFQLFDILNQSVSTRNATKPLAIHRDSSRFFFRHRIPIGAIFVVGAVYADYGLLTGAGNAAIVSLFNTKLPPGYVFWIVESLRYFLLVSCTVSVIVGILMVTSPDTLKALENSGGHWVSTRQMAPGAEKTYLTLDKWVAAFPKTAGSIILFPALGMVMYFGDQLLKRV
ncbi:MAG: hypothetical protein NT159_16975 [Proteobacteria bacterium]|nr:hypothetical protein [Pseudomonadota bacterium]